jgi:hypothetical protein
MTLMSVDLSARASRNKCLASPIAASGFSIVANGLDVLMLAVLRFNSHPPVLLR